MVAAFFLGTIIRYLLGNKKDRIIISDLFGKFSYRYNEKEKNRFSIILTLFNKSLQCLWQPAQQPTDNTTATILVYDGKNEFNTRQRYLHYILNEPYAYIWRQKLAGTMSIGARLAFSLFLIALLPVFLIIALFKENRAACGLVLLELVECKMLSRSLRSLPKVQNVIIFAAFEKDVPFIAAFLINKHHLSVQLVPSSNPLKNFYTRGICTTFTFTAAFHVKEFDTLKQQWFYTSTTNWPPFGYEDVLPRLVSFRKPPPRTIGFFSSGNWLREKEGHVSLGLNERQAEKLLQLCLKEFILKHPQYTLVIFLHPLEKRNEQVLRQTRDYYGSLYGEKIQFAPIEQNSVSNFDLVDLGIAVYSSTIFQRLFAGMKACFVPFDMPYNYFNDERLEKISIRNEADFIDSLIAFSDMDTDSFISRYEMTDYTYRGYGYDIGKP